MMSNTIIEVLNHLSDKFGLFVDWSSVNVLPYMSQLFHRISNYIIFKFSLLTAIFLIVAVIGFIFFKKKLHDDFFPEELKVIVFVVSLVSSILAVLMAISLAKAIIIPDVVVVKYIVNTINMM